MNIEKNNYAPNESRNENNTENDAMTFLLNKESFIAGSESEKHVDEYINDRPIVKELLLKAKNIINPKIFSGIKLGLKIFLISKMINGLDLQAQNKNSVESDKNFTENLIENNQRNIKDTSFIISEGLDTNLAQQTEKNKITEYLQKYGLENINFHTKESALFGQYSEIHEEYKEFTSDNPAFLRFGSALYSGFFRLKQKESDNSEAFNKIIPLEDSSLANKFAEELYIEFCQKHKIDPAKQLYFNGSYGGSLENDKYDGAAFALVCIGEEFVSDGYYTPVYITAIHELNHLQRFNGDNNQRAIGDLKTEAVSEIYTRINEIINKDYIYKKIHNIPVEEIVEYPEKLNSDYQKGLSVGLVANVFRKLLEKHETVEECLMSPEGQKFVTEYYKN